MFTPKVFQLGLYASCLALFNAAARADILYEDDFEDGIINRDVFSPLGDAVLNESEGKLFVTVFHSEDGVRINAPEGATCFTIAQAINRDEFDVREAILFRTSFFDRPTEQSFVGLEMTMLRPFWNFCEYTITQKDGPTETLKIFCGRGLSSRKDCPEVKNLRVDWVGENMLVYEVKQQDCTWKLGKTRVTGLNHENNRITEYDIVFKKINPDMSDGCPASGGDPSCGYTFELDDLVISDVHEPDSDDPIELRPFVLKAGHPGFVWVFADEPLFATSDEVVSFSAGVLIEDFLVITDFVAVAKLSVSARAPLQGRAVVAEGAHGLNRMSDFCIEGPDDPIENEVPTVSLTVSPEAPLAEQPFEVVVTFDDADGDFVEVFAAIKDLAAEEIVFRADRQVFDTATSDPDAEHVAMKVPGLPAGSYLLLGIVDDGLGAITVEEQAFSVERAMCPWDLDNDGTVGSGDLLDLLFNWGPCPGCAADFDGDDIVGASDLLAMLFNWGPCP